MNIKKIFVLAIFTIAIVGIIAPLNAVNIDNNVKIDSKSKTASYRITWDANGGKIGAKKTVLTTVKKNTKIGKLPTPKRTGYTFQGWYTKKTGGTKITKNTVVKKKAAFYVHWKKGNSNGVGNSADDVAKSKLLGMWGNYMGGLSYTYTYVFNANGTFSYVKPSITGNYKVSNGKITFSNIINNYNGAVFPSLVLEYKIGKYSNGKQYLQIPYMNPDKGFIGITDGTSKWDRWE